jgi:hypothetical protein
MGTMKLMHAVTLTAFLEDRAHRPFKKTYKLYVSSLPYEVEASGGQPITDYFSNSAAFENALKQLRTLRPVTLSYFGSSLRTRTRNSVIVTVSILGQKKWEPIWQRPSKGLGVAVFVCGTAFFASVLLLSLIMAVVVLTLTLAAGIFGRAIAGYIVNHVARTEPMVHIISRTKEEHPCRFSQVQVCRCTDQILIQLSRYLNRACKSSHPMLHMMDGVRIFRASRCLF